jgi:uncharacterized protein (TIGR00375 family)
MRILADLHVHSRYSRATSASLTPPRLERWARIKGLDLLGTGDCTHPAWLAELREALEPAEEGLFRLKDGVRREFDAGEGLAEPSPSAPPPRFVLTGEISTIYSRDGKTRKVHHLVILPGFEAAAAFQARLERVGNIASDGRPILGLDSRELFALLLEADERSVLVPAHVWTPWFSALGARSGFDSIDECYRDLAPRIGAIETGLSSNPPMNWALSSLDRFAIVSNSDAHSPEKLGREATILDLEEPSFAALAEAFAGGSERGKISGTVEFFPQEGKYHYEGHRSCGIVLSPEESAARGGLCPVCGKGLTPGVLGRVAELADRPVDEAAACPAEYSGTNRRPYYSLIPLAELLSELLGAGSGSKKVAAAYGAIVAKAGSEFSVLMDRSEAELESMGSGGVAGELLAEAIGRMRSGRVSIEPGYDGEYGVIRVFAPGKKIEAHPEAGLFGADDEDWAETPAEASPQPSAVKASRTKRRPSPNANQGRGSGARHRSDGATATDAAREPRPFKLDPEQERVLGHPGGPALVIAGPGTGKTALLALRVARLVEGAAGRPGLEPSSILALTFTNKAAGELRDRIGATIGERKSEPIAAATLHAFCLSVLRENSAEAGLPRDFSVLDEEERRATLEKMAGRAKARRLGAYIEERKRYLILPGEAEPRLGGGAPEGLVELARELGLPSIDAELDASYSAYREALREKAALDFDDLVSGTARLLAARPKVLASIRARFKAIFVDEYQDLNFAQYALVRILAPSVAKESPNAPELCVIGDPDQAIYGFRGSDRRLMDRFLVDYPGAAVYRLKRSFRCAPPIIGAAGRLVGKELEGTGEAVALWRSGYPSDKAEAEGIAREIDRLIGGTRFFAIDSGVAGAEEPELRSLGECAILVRAAALFPAIEKALFDHGIPYRLVGEKPWWEEEPAASIIRLLREGDAASRDGTAVEALRAAIDRIAERGERSPAAADSESHEERLLALASSYRELPAFLDALALGSSQDGYEARTERVALMTIHAAKGLEFDRVFVAGLEEGILPFTLFERGDAEEERRLLYVAMTRARVGLRLSWAGSRLFRGRELSLPPSSLLASIEELVPLSAAETRRPRDPQLGLF